MIENQKEFGKLTAEQFKSLFQKLPELRKEGSSLEKAVPKCCVLKYAGDSPLG